MSKRMKKVLILPVANSPSKQSDYDYDELEAFTCSALDDAIAEVIDRGFRIFDGGDHRASEDGQSFIVEVDAY